MSGHFIAGTLVSGCIYAMVVIGMVMANKNVSALIFFVHGHDLHPNLNYIELHNRLLTDSH